MRAPTPAELSPAQLLEALSRHRALLAGGLVAAAVASALAVLAPAAPRAVAVVTAAEDLPAGTVLDGDDLVPVSRPADVVPVGALRTVADAIGRHLAGPVRAGEALTDVRLLGAGLLTAGEQVAAPVRVAEPAVAALLRAGDRVDVLAASPEGGELARTVASDVAVLAVPQLVDDVGEGALVVVAASPATASRLAAAAVTGRLSVVVRGR